MAKRTPEEQELADLLAERVNEFAAEFDIDPASIEWNKSTAHIASLAVFRLGEARTRIQKLEAAITRYLPFTPSADSAPNGRSENCEAANQLRAAMETNQ